MQVVLLENIRSLGKIGDVITVKDGFGRNWLLPQKKVLRASKQNLKLFETQKKDFEKRNDENKAAAEKAASGLNGLVLEMISPAQANGVLYGSITIKDIHTALKNKDIAAEKNQINLHRPIKEAGEHKINIILHPEVACDITLFIASTKEAMHELMNPDDNTEEVLMSQEQTEEQPTETVINEEQAEDKPAETLINADSAP